MKNLLHLLMVALLLSSCKLTQEDLQNFDMTTFCDDYHVLMHSDNQTMYVFIDREEPKRRFFVWKNYKYKATKYGYMYSYKLDPANAVKNGIFGSAKEAVDEGVENLPKNGMVLYLHNLFWLGEGQWVTNGSILNELCPSKPKEEKASPKKQQEENVAEIKIEPYVPVFMEAPGQNAPETFVGTWRTSEDENSYISTYYDIGKEVSSWSNGNMLSFNFRNHMSKDTLLLVYVSSEVGGKGWVEEIKMPAENSLFAKCWMESGKLSIKYTNPECIGSFKGLYNDEQLPRVFGTTLYRN